VHIVNPLDSSPSQDNHGILSLVSAAKLVCVSSLQVGIA
jgi:hypothetical protein